MKLLLNINDEAGKEIDVRHEDSVASCRLIDKKLFKKLMKILKLKIKK